MKTVPLRRLLSSVVNGTWGTEPGTSEVDVRCVRAADFDFDDLKVTLAGAPLRGLDARSWERLRLKPGDIVLEKSGGGETAPVGRAVLFLDEEPAVTSNFAARVRAAPRVDPRFLVYVLRSMYDAGTTLRCIKQTTGIQNLDTEEWLRSPVPGPPLEEQRRVADFLDDRVARIERIIETRRMQLVLGEELFRSWLQSSVWVTESARPLKHLLTSVTSGPRGWGDRIAESGTPFVRIGNLSPLGIELRPLNLAQVTMPQDAEAERAALLPGDVLLSITAAFGEVAVWRSGEGAFSQHVARLRPQDTVDADWIAWMLQTARAHDQYRLHAYGGTKVGMGLDHVKNLKVPLVGPSKRRAISRSVNAEWVLHSSTVGRLRRSIGLLTEYKASLITAAVTGELDVTTAGSGIPE